MCFRKKRKPDTITTIFDIPVIDSKVRLQELSQLVYNLIESPKFAEISSKIPVPVGATQKDVEKLVHEYAPKKIKNILTLFIDDNFENIIKMVAIVFCQDYEFYKTKSINQICDDLSKLTKEQLGRLIGFFSRAGR